MHIEVAVKSGINAQLLGARTGKTIGDLGALLHDFAQLSSVLEAFAAFHLGGFDEERIATRRRPGQPGRHAGQFVAVLQFAAIAKARLAQQVFQIVGRDADSLGCGFGDLRDDFARSLADLAFQVAHAGLARVVADDLQQRLVREFELAGVQAIFAALARHQILRGDRLFFTFSIAAQLNDLHAVAQGTRDGIQRVGGGDEHAVAEVKSHIQIMIAEFGILFGVEHFQQRRARIATEIAPQLVDFVQHNQRIARLGAADGLDDTPGHRADICPPKTADLGFVADAAQAHADELAAHRPRYRRAQRCLADAGWPHECQDRARTIAPYRIQRLGSSEFSFALCPQFPHSQKFEDALFDILQSIMVFVQDGARVGDIQLVFGARVPRHAADPVQVGADNAIFSRRHRQLGQAVQFALGFFSRFVWHMRFVNKLAEAFDFFLVFIFFQFALDSFHLLAQVIIALRFLHFFLGVFLDFATQREHIHFF